MYFVLLFLSPLDFLLRKKWGGFITDFITSCQDTSQLAEGRNGLLKQNPPLGKGREGWGRLEGFLPPLPLPSTGSGQALTKEGKEIRVS